MQRAQRLADKIAIVTGAAKGIGLAVAQVSKGVMVHMAHSTKCNCSPTTSACCAG
jgi:NAD(P)-dependent dehydrogenase (short-subunit alcohol dehydrogenase family)